MKKASIIILQLFCLFIVLSFTANAQSNCTYSITGDTGTFYYEGGTRTANVTTQPGCGWQAIPSNDWITITSGQSGNGSGTVAYTVSQNNGNARAGTINVSGATLGINQRSNCFANFNSGPYNFPASGGTFRYPGPYYLFCSFVSINTMPAPWISETGNAEFIIAPNTGPARSAVIELTGPSGSTNGGSSHGFVTINQEAGQSNCTYSISSSHIRLPVSGGSGTVNITTQTGCQWSALSNNSWISLVGSITGTGNGQITFNVAQNTGALRMGSITVAGQTFYITQDTSCVFLTTPASVNLPTSGGQGSFVANLPPGCVPTTIGSLSPWIQVTNVTGSGDTRTVLYSVAPNTGAARTGTIVLGESISPPGGFFTINQASGCTYSISPNTIQAGAVGGDAGFNLTTQAGCNWTAQSNSNWLVVSNPTGSESGRISYFIQPNTGEARTGIITVGGQTFTVNQDAVVVQIEYLMATGQITANNRPVRDAVVAFTVNGETLTARTNHSGYFRLTVKRNQNYNVTISHKRYKFSGVQSVTYNSSNFVVIFAADQE